MPAQTWSWSNLEATLTKRELECLALAAQLRSDQQIAGELGLSHRTVEAHMASIRRKLTVPDRRSAARIYAEARGLLGLGSDPQPEQIRIGDDALSSSSPDELGGKRNGDAIHHGPVGSDRSVSAGVHLGGRSQGPAPADVRPSEAERELGADRELEIVGSFDSDELVAGDIRLSDHHSRHGRFAFRIPLQERGGARDLSPVRIIGAIIAVAGLLALAFGAVTVGLLGLSVLQNHH